MSSGFDSTFPQYHSQLISAGFRTNFSAVASHHKGATAPTSLVDGMSWIDTSDGANHRLKFYRTSSADWLTVISKVGGIGLLSIPVNNYTHSQAVPSATWTITHSFGKYPSVMVVNPSRSQIAYSTLTYTDTNTVTITFSAPQDGYAYLT